MKYIVRYAQDERQIGQILKVEKSDNVHNSRSVFFVIFAKDGI
jgi:hypothetical protein